jgi:hypothetical protein
MVSVALLLPVRFVETENAALDDPAGTVTGEASET